MFEGGSELREQAIDSWLDPVASVRLSKRLGDALAERFRGKRGVFLSLTYDRSKFTGPMDCYRKMSEQRHVRKFIKRLACFLGVDLAGKYICKLEFQMGDGVGYPHFHLMIEGIGFVPQAKLAELWGHGFVWISAATRKRCKYFAKYIAKADDVPAWILQEPPRSVKIVRTSPGFWGVPPKVRDRAAVVKRGRPFCWVPIGTRLHERRGRVIARSADGKRYRRVNCPVWLAAIELAKRGGKVVGVGRWLRCEYGLSTLVAILEAAAGGAPAKPGSPRLHLKDSGNPPGTPGPEDLWVPWLVDSMRAQGVLEWRNAA